MSTHSYAIILPKELVTLFGWRERQKLAIIFGGRKSEVVIRDRKKSHR